MLSSSIIALFALSFVSVSAMNLLIDENRLKDAHSEINSLLAEEFETDDSKVDIEAAKEFLRNPDASSELVSASKLFAIMETLAGTTNRCSPQAVDLLRKNDLALFQRACKKSSKGECKTRVGNVLNHYADISAKQCPSFFADLFRQKVENYDPKKYEQVKDLTDSIISNQIIKNNRVEFGETKNWPLLAQQLDILRHPKTNDQWFYNFLCNRVEKADKNLAKYLVRMNNGGIGLKCLNEEKFKEIFEQYGIKPCKDYVETFGPEVFEPSIFLSKFHHDELADEEQYHENEVRYKLCKNLINNQGALLDRCMEEATLE